MLFLKSQNVSMTNNDLYDHETQPLERIPTGTETLSSNHIRRITFPASSI